MKYIVINQLGLEIPIIFPNLLLHKEVAANHEVVSAGECSFYIDGPVDHERIKCSVWGKSIGLNILSRKEDGLLIEKCFGY